MKIALVAAVAVIFVTNQVHAQECKDLIKTATSQYKASMQALQQSDDLKDVAMSRFKSNSNFERPTQQAFAKLVESRNKMADAVATLTEAVNKNCGEGIINERDNGQDNLEMLEHSIASMREAAPELGVKLPG